MNQTYTAYYQSPIGLVEIVADDQAIKSVYFVEAERAAPPAQLPPLLADGLAQLAAYFQGERQEFSLPLEPAGTDFQKRVWRQLLTVPYGKTASYMDIAKAVATEKAVRAVGLANGQNPISIIIPCHRIIGSDGSLTGYGGGLWRKEWLLKHEGSLGNSLQMSLF
jgi:methylated-DNA-[protein]-cysteine S-methyltransferase